MKRMGLKLIMSQEERARLEEALDFLDVFLVDQEHNNVVILLDDGCIVSNQHIVATDDGANRGTRRQA